MNGTESPIFSEIHNSSPNNNVSMRSQFGDSHSYKSNEMSSHCHEQNCEDEFTRRWTMFVENGNFPVSLLEAQRSMSLDAKHALIRNYESKVPEKPAILLVNKLKELSNRRNKCAPKFYLPRWTNNRLVYLKHKMPNEHEWTPLRVLSCIEISLATNSSAWANDFFDHGGLEALTDYTSTLLAIVLKSDYAHRSVHHISKSSKSVLKELVQQTEPQLFNAFNDTSSLSPSQETLSPSSMRSSPSLSSLSSCNSSVKNSRKSHSKESHTKTDAENDVWTLLNHSVRCFRVILNTQRGCVLASSDSQTIHVITLCLLHSQFMVKMRVLDILKAICMLEGGSELVLNAFYHFNYVTQETLPFQRFMRDLLTAYEHHPRYVFTAVQFLNSFVHSKQLQDYNLRVYLQHHFLQLGVDGLLQKIIADQDTSKELAQEAKTYLANQIRVKQLLQEVDEKEGLQTALDELRKHEAFLQNILSQKEEQLCIARKKWQDHEHIWRKVLHTMKQGSRPTDTDINTINSSLDNICGLPSSYKKPIPIATDVKAHESSSSPTSLPPPPPPLPGSEPKIKLKVISSSPKAKMVPFHWSPLPATQLRDTIFNHINMSRIETHFNFADFEQTFRASDNHKVLAKMSRCPKVSLLDGKMQRCAGVLVHYLERKKFTEDSLLRDIATMELETSIAERIAALKLTEKSTEALVRYERSNQAVESLCKEDRWILSLSKIRRLNQRVGVIIFMANFERLFKVVYKKIECLSNATLSVLKSDGLKDLFGVILCLGNFMNYHRGPTLGFRLQSLDMIAGCYSADKKCNLMQFLVKSVETSFPHLKTFYKELHGIEEASKINAQVLQNDVDQLCEGMKKALIELSDYEIGEPPEKLVNFIADHESDIETLRRSHEEVIQLILKMAELLGEKTAAPSSELIFAILTRFTAKFKNCIGKHSHRSHTGAKTEVEAMNGHSHSSMKVLPTTSSASTEESTSTSPPQSADTNECPYEHRWCL